MMTVTVLNKMVVSQRIKYLPVWFSTITFLKKLFTRAVIAILLVPTALADERISIVGSSTVYPFSTVVAERFAQITGNKAPIVEATGTGGGMKLFCAETGAETPDIVNASRRMKKSEQQWCYENGVTDITEVKIGYDGIVVARSLSGDEMVLDRRQLFSALAREITDDQGQIISNPHKTWQAVDASLPAQPIIVYGPPPTSGTRDAFVELVIEAGCRTYPELAALKKSNRPRYQSICHSIREDGAYIELGENDNLVIQKLVNEPRALGIFGFNFLEQNQDKVRGLSLEGVLPIFDTIADSSYSVSRPLYFYVKRSNYTSTARLEAFVRFFIQAEVMGEDGILVDRGLIPLPAEEYNEQVAAVANHLNMETL